MHISDQDLFHFAAFVVREQIKILTWPIGKDVTLFINLWTIEVEKRSSKISTRRKQRRVLCVVDKQNLNPESRWGRQNNSPLFNFCFNFAEFLPIINFNLIKLPMQVCNRSSWNISFFTSLKAEHILSSLYIFQCVFGHLGDGQQHTSFYQKAFISLKWTFGDVAFEPSCQVTDKTAVMV